MSSITHLSTPWTGTQLKMKTKHISKHVGSATTAHLTSIPLDRSTHDNESGSESCWHYLNFIKASSMTMTSKDIWSLKWKEMVLNVEYLWKAYWKTRWKLSKKTSPGATRVLKPSPFFLGQRSHGAIADPLVTSDSLVLTLPMVPMVPMDPWVDASISESQMVYIDIISKYQGMWN